MSRRTLALLFVPAALAVSAQAHAMGATTTAPAAGGNAAGGTAAGSVGTATRSVGAAAGASPGAGSAGSATGAATTALPTTSRPPSTLTGRLFAPRNRVATKTHHGKHNTSTLAIVIDALGALLLLGSAAWALARRRAFEPHWWLTMRHSIAEAGYRMSVLWAEFTDWVRLGH